jgi:nucleotide-binding universal stress UspA family protein
MPGLAIDHHPLAHWEEVMKSILLYANDDSGMESRLQAALDLARAFDAHISCLQVTPFDSFIMGDPFGGVYAMPAVIDAVRKAEGEHRARLEERLRGEGVSWDWARFDGSPAQLAADRSRLCDLIVLSLPAGSNYDGPLSMVGDVVLHASAPVLAVPQPSRGLDYLGEAIVAWNGTLESCHALRLAVPLLQKAAQVRIVTVTDDETEFPAIGASEYLARHGIETVLHEWPRDGRSMSEALLDAAHALAGAYVVMGAYGHSRLQESLLGGTTRDMIRSSTVPLLLAH